MHNIGTVQRIYMAFSRGDIPAIIDYLSDTVEWEYGIAETDVPWLQRRHGKDGAIDFFKSIRQFELHKFEPKTFLESGNVVVVLIDVELTIKATGITIVEEDETHIWHFNSQGQVVKFGHKVDTHRHWLAYQNRNL